MPGLPPDRVKDRTGFLARLRVETLGNWLFPLQHSSREEDDLAIAAELRTSDSQAIVLVLYRGIVTLNGISAMQPLATCPGAHGSECHFWHLTDAVSVRRFEQAFDGNLVLADGMASYQAALRAKRKWITAAFVSVEDPGLVVLPRHRVVRGKPDFQTGILVMNSRAYFFFSDVSRLMPPLEDRGPRFDPTIAQSLLQPTTMLDAEAAPVLAEEAGATISPGAAHNSTIAPGDVALLAVTAKQSFRLHSKPGWADSVLQHLPQTERNVDLVQLHRIILEGVLELPEAQIRAGKYVSYYRDPLEAVRQVQAGADVAFILSPPKLDTLYDLALRGVVLPHHSLEFYPSLDGLAIHARD